MGYVEVLGVNGGYSVFKGLSREGGWGGSRMIEVSFFLRLVRGF